MAFWGCSLKAGQKHQVTVAKNEVLHLSQACLHQPGAGKTYLQVQVEGKTYTIGCLEKDKVETLALDLFFSAPPTFVNTGKSELHLSGYTEPKGTGEDMLEDEESEEEAAKPAAAKASPKAAAAKAAASPKAAKAASPKAAAAKAPAKPAEDDEDEESEEEGDESEDQPAPKAKAKAQATPAKKAQEADDDDEDEEEEEDEESEEEAPAKAAPAAKKGKEAAPEKRKAPEAATPPAKKAKGAAAAAATPGSPKAAAAGGEAEYVKAVADFLKKNGKTKFADLGAKVKRPEGVPKMKVVFGKHADRFVLDGDSVALK